MNPTHSNNTKHVIKICLVGMYMCTYAIGNITYGAKGMAAMRRTGNTCNTSCMVCET